MKILMKKNLVLFLSILLVAVMLISTSFTSAFAFNKDDVDASSDSESSVNLIEDAPAISEKKDKETFTAMEEGFVPLQMDDELMALKAVEKVAIIEEELARRDTDVMTELEKKIVQYEKMLLDETSMEKCANLQNLIDVTNQLTLYYQLSKGYNIDNYSTDNYSAIGMPIMPVIDTNLPSAAYVSAVIAGFSALHFELAAELTTVAFSNKYVNTEYVPAFGSRVLASDIVYNIASGTSVSDGTEFPKVDMANTYQQDVYFAIRRFNYTKPSASSKIVNVIDTYDFDPEGDRKPGEDTGIQGFAIDLMYEAQVAGVIHPVKFRITVDTSEFLKIRIDGKSGATWCIQVTNYKNKAIDVVYNSKMCYESDVSNWLGLTDIATVRIQANSIQYVYVQENVLATHFAFCYVENGKRFITYANETYLSTIHNLNMDTKVIDYHNYGDVGLVGKNGNTWFISVTNIHDEWKTIEYNSKMCFEGDAKNWTGLKDICYGGYIGTDESRIIAIQENAFATHIAIRLNGDTESIIIYANQLNINCTMNVSRITNYKYNYLSLSNSGKSGSTWLINITNPTDSVITVYYNTKMCFEGDAKNWSGLNNVSSFTLGARATKQVSISTNGFATSITTSFFHKNGKRVISYANGLNKNGNISVSYNYI